MSEKIVQLNEEASKGQTIQISLGIRKPRKTSVFVDKAVNQIITATESAMGEEPSCKATG